MVQPGDTLSGIAKRHQVTVAELAELNGLDDPNLIHVGQKLRIPSTASTPVVPVGGAIPYRVQRGDTLSLLARRYGTTVEAIAEANGLEDPDRIIAGQLLSIPTPLAGETPKLPIGPIVSVQVLPPVVEQGQTLLIRVQLASPAQVEVAFEDLPVRMFGEDRMYWGVAPVGALAEPGRKQLRVRAVDEAGEATLIWPVWVVQGDYPVQHITLPPGKGMLLDPQRLRAERERLAQVWRETAERPLWQGRFVTPLAPGFVVSSPFGTRRSYNGGPVNSYHEGYDMAIQAGTAVVAPAAGRVLLAEELTVRGKAIVIDHGLGVHTGYWHLSAIEVEPGQWVKPGDLIGRAGSTGLSTGAHLHWELRIGAVPVDPMEWTRRTFP